MKANECRIPLKVADDSQFEEGDTIWMQVNVDRMIYMQWDMFVDREMGGSNSGDVPEMLGDILFPCKIVGINDNIYGKAAKDLKDSLFMMEFDEFFETIVPYMDLDPQFDDFGTWLKKDAKISDTSDVVLMTLPAPRLKYYQSSDFDEIQNNVVGYAS